MSTETQKVGLVTGAARGIRLAAMREEGCNS